MDTVALLLKTSMSLMSSSSGTRASSENVHFSLRYPSASEHLRNILSYLQTCIFKSVGLCDVLVEFHYVVLTPVNDL